MKEVNLDVISDLHIEQWLNWGSNNEKNEVHLEKFVKEILPDFKSEILLICGDLGHSNKQIVKFLNRIKKEYKTILIVPGNHDYYLVSRNIRYKYSNDSLKRWNELVNSFEDENIKFLDGEIFEYEGIKIGGVGMWYDFTYGQKVFGYSYEMIRSLWKSNMNDSSEIFGLPHNTIEFFEEQKEKFEKILKESDIIMTHVGPDFKQPKNYINDVNNSFFYFNAEPYIEDLENKVWFFGHTHERMDYEAYGCHMMCVALGYEGEFEKENRKIINYKFKKEMI